MNREDTKKAIEVMQAFADGKTIETRFLNSPNISPFVECPSPTWEFNRYAYRIKAPMPDSIDWSQVDDNYICMFRFSSGAKVLCTSIPYLSEGKPKYWKNIGFCANVQAFKSYKQGDLPWDESLVVRPKKKEYSQSPRWGID